MDKLPHYLERQAAESGNVSDELLFELIKTIREQNTILDDTIHGELVGLNSNLVAIVAALRSMAVGLDR